MPSPLQLGFLADRALSIDTEIGRVANKDHPFALPLVIYDALQRALRGRMAMLGASQSRPERDLNAVFLTVGADLKKIFSYFSAARRVDSARIPFELLRPLSTAATSLLGRPSYVIIRLHHEYTYTIDFVDEWFRQAEWLRSWLDALDAAFPASAGAEPPRPHILLLGFPAPEADSTLMHVLAAHEFGHQLFREWAPQLKDGLTKARTALQTDPAWKAEIDNYVATQTTYSTTGALPKRDAWAPAKMVQRYGVVTDHWLQEVFSDLLAAHLVGPAYLAAFDRLGVSMMAASDHYPPSVLRRRFVMKYLGDVHPGVAEDKAWGPTTTSSTASPEYQNDFVWSVAAALCEGAFECLRDALRALPSPLKREDLSQVVQDMEDHLDRGVSPSLAVPQTWCVADGFWCILHAAWRFRQDPDRYTRYTRRWRMADPQKDAPGSVSTGAAGDPRADAALSAAVRHSLGSLDLRYRWEERRTTNGGGRG